MDGCPTSEMLVGFVEGRLPAALREGVERHLDACASCLRVVGMAARSDDPAGEPDPTWPPFDADRYELRGEHARGGIGVVLRAFDRRLGREIALKLLATPTPEARARFAREATITARLQHPSIVAVHDVGCLPDGTPGYTMPFYPGRSLREAIAARPGFAERMQLLRHGLAVSEAIAHAHARGVLHRDLKPSNVLLGLLGETVVIDWGLAKLEGATDAGAGPASGSDPSGEATRTGAVLGTPSYMPPEQARGQRVDARADVYALGALLYHVLVGRAPFAGSTSAEVLRQLLTGPPVDVQEARPEVPDDLAALVRKAMAPGAGDRYRDAGELAEELRRFLDGELVRAHAYSAGERVLRWLRRNRKLAALALVALVALLALGGFDLRRVRAQRARADANAREANGRADALVLEEARTALAQDPTLAIAWLKTYPESGGDWRRVRALADDALSRGVARRVLHRNDPADYDLQVQAGGQEVVGFDGLGELRRWSLASGRSSARCLPVAAAWYAPLADTPGRLVYHEEDGATFALSAGGDAVELVEDEGDATVAAGAPAGTRLATGGPTGALRVFEPGAGGGGLYDWMDGPIEQLAFLGDHALLVHGGAWAREQLWDLDRGTLRFVGAPFAGAAYTRPGAPQVAWQIDGGLVWMDATTLELAELPAQLYLFHPVALLTDGRVALADRKRGVLLWDPRRGEVEVQPRLAAGWLALSADDAWIASGTPNGAIRVLERGSGDVRTFYGHAASTVQEIVFLPGDDAILSSASDGSARLWPLARGAPQRIWRVDPEGSHRVEIAVREDGGLVVAAGPDGVLWRRDLPDGQPLRLGDEHHKISKLAFLPGGAELLVADDAGELSRWSMATGERRVIARDVPALTRLVVSADGRQAAGLSYHAREAWRWDLASGQATLLASGAGLFENLELAPDQRWVAVDGSPGGRESGGLVELPAGKVRPIRVPGAPFRVLAFSPSSRYLFGAREDDRPFRVDVGTGEVRLARARARGNAALALGDGVVLLAGPHGLSAWFVGADAVVPVDDPGTEIVALEASPSRRRLLGIGADFAVYVWDLDTLERKVLRGHDEPYESAHFAGEDQVVSAGGDGTVRIWSVPRSAPPGPRATHEWLESLTDLEVGAGPGHEPPGCP